MAPLIVRTISRYLLRQHVAPLGFALAALTSLMLIQQVAKQLSGLLGKGLPTGVIIEVFVLSLPFIVAVTLPMAVLVAVLQVFTRLAGDNEITALQAGGVSVMRPASPCCRSCGTTSCSPVPTTSSARCRWTSRVRSRRSRSRSR